LHIHASSSSKRIFQVENVFDSASSKIIRKKIHKANKKKFVQTHFSNFWREFETQFLAGISNSIFRPNFFDKNIIRFFRQNLLKLVFMIHIASEILSRDIIKGILITKHFLLLRYRVKFCCSKYFDNFD